MFIFSHKNSLKQYATFYCQNLKALPSIFMKSTCLNPETKAVKLVKCFFIVMLGIKKELQDESKPKFCFKEQESLNTRQIFFG